MRTGFREVSLRKPTTRKLLQKGVTFVRRPPPSAVGKRGGLVSGWVIGETNITHDMSASETMWGRKSFASCPLYKKGAQGPG